MMMHNHPFHLVTLSPWPIISAFNLLNLLFSSIIWFYMNISFFFLMNFIIMIMSSFQWWRDIIRESTFQGFHTFYVMNLLKLSMILFIISELFFFISFFWTYLHNSIAPSIEIGMNWPPKNIIPFNPYNIPLLNSLILISSGMMLTWSHYCLLNMNYLMNKISLILTIILGMYFSFLQYIEYKESFFTFNDSIFGSIFYLSTGFHGIHVIVGILLLFTCFIRLKYFHFSSLHHFHFEAATWYWHFVDVIWLFLYFLIYWWMY